MLDIKDLSVQIHQKRILKDLSLSVQKGEVHAIMGPNGSGKSTLAKTIAGYPHLQVVDGSIYFEVNGKLQSLQSMEPDLRSKEGIFFSFQNPLEIPGLSNFDFLYSCFKSICLHKGVSYFSKEEFRKWVLEKSGMLEFDSKFLDRFLNEDFSGGEKKKNEVLQMIIFDPKLAILDEIDSGLDVDALKMVANAIKIFHSPQKALILITHYQRILEYVKPDYVHVFHQGQIIKTGDWKLACQIENKGYDSLNIKNHHTRAKQ